jgi:hypothetical protein
MSEGFKQDKIPLELKIYTDEVDKLLKQYKSVKKYMKSPLYQIKKLDGTETFVTNLIKEAEENPL